MHFIIGSCLTLPQLVTGPDLGPASRTSACDKKCVLLYGAASCIGQELLMRLYRWQMLLTARSGYLPCAYCWSLMLVIN